jgi:hypothetical protein
LPEDWQLLPNIAIFQERIERGFDNEELLSVTIAKGVIRQSDVDIKKEYPPCKPHISFTTSLIYFYRKNIYGKSREETD